MYVCSCLLECVPGDFVVCFDCKPSHHWAQWQHSISLFCSLCLEWEDLLLRGVSCGAGVTVVSRLQSAGAGTAAMLTAESHLDSWLGTQPGSLGVFFFFFFCSFTWAARTASLLGGWVLRKSLWRERGSCQAS